MSDITTTDLFDNEDQSQFEMTFEGQKAFIEYVTKDDKVYLTHTSVPKALEGRGIGSALVEKTLRKLADQNATVVPLCSFVAHYIDNHPEFQSLLSDGYQM